MKKPLVFCLMGPTASGKTALAVELVQRFPFEIVSVDSAMVYRGMDIGTAKPSAEILKIAPHRLLDICDPADYYSAGQFKQDALREIEDILAAGKIPLLTGGTMLYFHILEHGLDELPKQDAGLRAELEEEAASAGWAAMHEQLKVVDPQAAARIHPNDSQRIQRALEVYRLTGQPLSEKQSGEAQSLPFELKHLIVAPSDRAVLHKRIEQRFDQMLEQGFMEEVRGLFARGDLSLDKPALRSVGYRQAWEYLSGNCSQEEMREKAIIATRQLAKRQLTWLRRWEGVEWVDSEESGMLNKVLDNLSAIISK